jgi:thiamine-phosphate pyrophosphorylase
MLVTDDRLVARRDLGDLVRRAVEGGVTSVQLRLKEASARELLAFARRLRDGLPVPVLVNDRPDVAAAAGLGVHLGPDDLPVGLARSILPAGAVIGASVGGAAEADLAEGADYWGLGPWRVTTTKSDAGESLGPEGFRRIVALARGRPCIAIGGVRPEDVAEILAAGATGIAVVSGILGSDDVAAAARSYAERLGPGRDVGWGA